MSEKYLSHHPMDFSSGDTPMTYQKTTPTPVRPVESEAPTLQQTAPHNPVRPMAPISPTRPQHRYPAPRTKPRSSENWGIVLIAISMLGCTIISSIGLIFVLNVIGDSTDELTPMKSNQAEPTSILYNTTDLEGVPPIIGEYDPFADAEWDPNAIPAFGTAQPISGAIANSLNIEPWDGKERFTVLLMGLDNRPNQPKGTCRTDTMMIISIDPINKRIGMLSIPRDTYVEVPGYGLHRVNAACTIGNVNNAGSGPILAMQTVQYNFGIRINDYFMVDFNTFINFIDKIGGIEVDVPRTINDPAYPSMNYGYDPFYLEAGPHHLDGATALKYARSRHDAPEGDIERARRQQQIIYAVRDKVLSLNMLDDLLAESPQLWKDFEDGIATGLSLEQVVRLIVYASEIPNNNITSNVVTYDYLIGYRTEGGASVLIPNRNKLISLMLEVFGEGYNQ